jgi:hypothetical protein
VIITLYHPLSPFITLLSPFITLYHHEAEGDYHLSSPFLSPLTTLYHPASPLITLYRPASLYHPVSPFIMTYHHGAEVYYHPLSPFITIHCKLSPCTTIYYPLLSCVVLLFCITLYHDLLPRRGGLLLPFYRPLLGFISIHHYFLSPWGG